MRAARTSLLALVVALASAACCADCGRRFTFVITNRTSETLVIRLEEPGREADVATIEPERNVEAGDQFLSRPSCFGPWVARDLAGREVARLAKACPGSSWSIAPVPSHDLPSPGAGLDQPREVASRPGAERRVWSRSASTLRARCTRRARRQGGDSTIADPRRTTAAYPRR